MGIDSIKREQRKPFPELLDVFKTDDAKADAHKMVPGDTIDKKVLDRISIDSRGFMVMTRAIFLARDHHVTSTL